jgi:hypothetical protein
VIQVPQALHGARLLVVGGLVAWLALVAGAPRAAAARSPKVYFTTYPGAGFTDPEALAVRPKDLQMSGDASWIIDDVRWSSWGGSVAHGTGVSDVDNCTPQCAGGKHLTVPSRITLSRIGLLGADEVYQCISVTSSGPPSFALQRAQQRYCLTGASPLPPGTAPPAGTTGPPTVSGTARAGGRLSCSGGSVTVNATRVVYQWVRDGTPIPGAASRLYRVRKVDEGLTLTCSVTAYAAGVVTGTAASGDVRVAVPFVSGCPGATGTSSQLLGLLGVTRADALRAFARSSSSGQQYEDSFCLTPFGVLVGYPPPGLLAALPTNERGQLAGRVVWITTANASYSVLGVRAGATVAAAGAVLNLAGPFSVDSSVWYLAQDGPHVVVLIVRGGIVIQVGVADWSLTGGEAGELAFLRGLGTIYRQSLHVSGPLKALDAYWAAIGAHRFLAATGYLLPGVLGSPAAFVDSEQHEHIQSAQFQGHIRTTSGSGATVQVVSLITHDRQFGCRTWKGSYRMTRRAERWLIAGADIHPRPCAV